MNARVNIATVKCRLCQCDLDEAEADDFANQLCDSCIDRPEARRLGIPLPPRAPRRPHIPKAATTNVREFTRAEQSLIARVHNFMPRAQLLEILNERLVCDLGPDCTRYTSAQLEAAIAVLQIPSAPNGTHDRASLRRLLAAARRDGSLAKVDPQVIDDFAVVFSLNVKQVTTLNDIVLQNDDGSSQ